MQLAGRQPCEPCEHKAFEGVTVTEQGRFVRAAPVGSRTRSSTEESEAASVVGELALGIISCSNANT